MAELAIFNTRAARAASLESSSDISAEVVLGSSTIEMAREATCGIGGRSPTQATISRQSLPFCRRPSNSCGAEPLSIAIADPSIDYPSNFFGLLPQFHERHVAAYAKK